MAQAERDVFCDRCGVVLDLHPSEKQTDEGWECEVANSKVAVLVRFDRIFSGNRQRGGERHD